MIIGPPGLIELEDGVIIGPPGLTEIDDDMMIGPPGLIEVIGEAVLQGFAWLRFPAALARLLPRKMAAAQWVCIVDVCEIV